MKEFTSQVGGRYTYIDDILNLQELSLAMTSIFEGCDNFVINGCQVSGNTISAGYVFINGKIRYCAGSSNVAKFPAYLCESNTVEKVSYADSGDKVGRNVYGCVVSSNVPTNTDTLTGQVPQFIRIEADGSVMRMKDAFFGKYALVIDSAYASQSVKKDVSFGANLNVGGAVNAVNGLTVTQGTSKATVSYVNNSLVVQSSLEGKSAYKLVISSDGDFQFYIGNTLLATIGNGSMRVNAPLNLSTINAGNIRTTSNNIYDYATSSDNGNVQINMVGYNGISTYYRNTTIGDGKGNMMFELNGANKTASIYSGFTVHTPTASGVQLRHSTLSKTDKTLLSYMSWLDKDNVTMAHVGYFSNADYSFYIKNKIGDVVIDNNTSITGSLYVGGKDLLATLASKSEMNTGLSSKANAVDVYSKTTSDSRYIQKTDSIQVFVDNAGGGTTGQSSVRNTIGAASQTEMVEAAKKGQSLKDIVAYGLPSTSDPNYSSNLVARKRQLCENIGAIYKDDVVLNQKDTGWISMQVQNCGITTQLHVRQVGHVVSIQGELHTHHSGLIFTLPNTIDPPKYEIGYSHNKDGKWHCIIKGNSRDCVVDYCNSGCSEYIGFLMTYLV